VWVDSGWCLECERIESRPDSRGGCAAAILVTKEVLQMEALGTYTSVLAVFSVALLLVAPGLSKKQLVWRAKRVPIRRRRRS
jgi:hypothetical protein